MNRVIGWTTADVRGVGRGRSWRTLGGRSVRHSYGRKLSIGRMRYVDEVTLFDRVRSVEESSNPFLTWKHLGLHRRPWRVIQEEVEGRRRRVKKSQSTAYSSYRTRVFCFGRRDRGTFRGGELEGPGGWDGKDGARTESTGLSLLDLFLLVPGAGVEGRRLSQDEATKSQALRQ